MNRTILAALMAALPSLGLAEVEVHDSYAISASPHAGAAFMVIHNHGGPDDRLLSVTSPAAQRVELHTHVHGADGTMQMVPVSEGWPLPTDGELLLERGGDHVMFMGLAAPWADGDVIPLTLVFEQAGEIALEITVDLDRLGGDGGHGMQDGDAMHHGDGHGMHHGDGEGIPREWRLGRRGHAHRH